MQSYLNFMGHLSERIDMLTEAFTELSQSLDTVMGLNGGVRGACCNCVGNDVDGNYRRD